MQLCDHTDVISGVFVDRNDRLHTNLKIFSRPDHPRIDCAGGWPGWSAVQRSFHCELYQRNQSIYRCRQMHVLDLRLQINHAVLQRKTPLEDVRMSLDVNVAFGRLPIHCDSARARTAWNGDACYTRKCERFQKTQRFG